MRRLIAGLGFTMVLATAAASFTGLPNSPRHLVIEREADATFLIPASDGYGVADCLSGRHECGKVVADAWCESQGFSMAAAYGLAATEDVTGSVEVVRAAEGTARPISITCAK